MGGRAARPGLAPPADPGAYAGFVAELARSVPSVGAIEIWNEADEGEFWAGAPEPARYAALLRAAYPAIKAANSDVTVVTTGMVGNNFRFLAAASTPRAAAGRSTRSACTPTPPACSPRRTSTTGSRDGRVGRFSFTGYREVHDVMAANGDGGQAASG